MSAPVATSAQITKAAKSNLAFALKLLPPERRADMNTFYAFCRIADDLADDLELPIADKRRGLEQWRTLLTTREPDPDLAFLNIQEETLALQKKYQIPVDYLTNIIDGCLMDLQPQRFGNWEELQGYTFNVASSVGLASLPIFGADLGRSRNYAIALGHALQLTNILRDVGEDLQNGVRIYLPLLDFSRFTYTERDLIGRVYDDRFRAMMAYQADRAESYYQQAEAALPREDRDALLAPRAMHRIYYQVLQRMRADHFQVFEKRYRVPKLQKMWLLAQEKWLAK